MDTLLSTTRADEARRATARRAVVGYLGAGLVWLVGTVAATRLGAAPASTVALVGVTTFLAGSALALWRLLHRRSSASGDDVARPDAPAVVPDVDELERLRSMVLRAVSEELRAPVTTMIGCAETIRRHHATLSPKRVEELAGRVVTDGRRLDGHLSDLLELRSTDAVSDRAIPAGVDVGELLAEVVAAHADGSHVLEARADVEPVVLDPSNVRRIVGELVDNVRRHTPPGTTATLTAVRHGDEVHIVVEDDGPGLDPVVAATVGEPLVQGRHVAAHARPGLGLGLAVAVRYAELQGGRLELSSRPGGGTRATVRLPAVTAATIDVA